MLLEAGARIIWGDGAWTTALHLAYKGDHLEVARLLRESESFNLDAFWFSDKDHWNTLLDEVATSGDVPMMALLLADSSRASLLGVKRWGELVLHAICGEHEEMVRRLLAVAPLGLRYKRALVTEAVWRNCPNSLRALLDQVGILVDGKDAEWMTALHRAAKYGYTEILDVLIEYGAQLDTRALCIAIGEGHVAFIRALLAGGLDPRNPHCSGMTSIDYVESLIVNYRSGSPIPRRTYCDIRRLLIGQEPLNTTAAATSEEPLEAVGPSMSSSSGLSLSSSMF